VNRSRKFWRYNVGEVMTKDQAVAAGAVFKGANSGTGAQYTQCWCMRCFECFYAPIGPTVSISKEFERKLPLCAFDPAPVCQQRTVGGQPHAAPNPNASGVQLLANQLKKPPDWDGIRQDMQRREMPLAQVYAAVTKAIAAHATHRTKSTKDRAAQCFVLETAREAVANFEPPQAAPPTTHPTPPPAVTARPPAVTARPPAVTAPPPAVIPAILKRKHRARANSCTLRPCSFQRPPCSYYVHELE